MRVDQESLTRVNARQVKEAVVRAALAGDEVIDLSAVVTADSSALAVLLAWLRKVQMTGGSPEIRGVPDKVLSLMDLYGLRETLGPYIRN